MAKKKSTKKKASKAAANEAPLTKSQIHAHIADKTGLAKKDVAAVFEELEKLIGRNLKRGPQVFKLPGLAKIAVRKKPATKARMGRNPATGEEMMFKAKPASKKVKITPLKNLKEAAGAK